MTLARTNCVALTGLIGELINVEVDIGDGLPNFSLLGLPDAALLESRDRVRSALINSGQIWPNRKVIVSLTPAWLPKSGSAFDLPIAIALLVASGLDFKIDETVFIGELSLDGTLRQTRGVLPGLICAHKNGIKRAIIPKANAAEAKLIPEIETICFETISELLHWVETGERFDSQILDLEIEHSPIEDFSDIAGQPNARRAAEIAAAGGHNLLMIGPPGVGKTMIAKRMPTILPPLNNEQALEVTAIHSITNSDRAPLSKIAPFVAPHHTTTRVAMVGGGSHSIKPGAISLAHHGILFIDEAPECLPGILDSLRQPLESGSISIARATGNLTFPANFILVIAANPCPCGKFVGKGRACTCTPLQVRRYLAKLSGPLLDRIDLRVKVEPVSRIELAQSGESSHAIRDRVVEARAAAAKRFATENWKINSQIPSRALNQKYRATKPAMAFLHDELDREQITARGLHKILRTSWTIADLAKKDQPDLAEVQSAYKLREGNDY
jgi:magnesium chelatase family protein